MSIFSDTHFWEKIKISIPRLYAAIQDGINSHTITDDSGQPIHIPESGGGGSTGPYPPGSGNPPGTGTGNNNDGGSGWSGVGGATWTDETGGVKKVCLDPPILLDGPHWEDLALQVTPGSGIIPVQHTADFTAKIQSAYRQAFGPYGKLFRFKGGEMSFDGCAITHIEYHEPIDFGVDVLFPLNPKIIWTEAGGASPYTDINPTATDLLAHVIANIGGADLPALDITFEEFDEANGHFGAGIGDTPNSGHFVRCNTIGGGYSLSVLPPYAEIDESTPLAHDHTGLRWFLECVYCHPPTDYEATMPCTCAAAVNDGSALTTGYSATHPHNGMMATDDFSLGVAAWYSNASDGVHHAQLFLPEGATATKIVCDIDVTNPTGVSDADWDVRVRNDRTYDGLTGTWINYSGTLHNHGDGIGAIHTVHVEVPLLATYDCCTPFDVQIYGGVLVTSVTFSFA